MWNSSLQKKELLLVSSGSTVVYLLFVQKVPVISRIKAALGAVWVHPQKHL